jgi:hypothetical protein
LAGFLAVEVALVCEGVEDACAAGDACTVADPITNVARASALTVTAVRTGSSFPEPIRSPLWGKQASLCISTNGIDERRHDARMGDALPVAGKMFPPACSTAC